MKGEAGTGRVEHVSQNGVEALGDGGHEGTISGIRVVKAVNRIRNLPRKGDGQDGKRAEELHLVDWMVRLELMRGKVLGGEALLYTIPCPVSRPVLVLNSVHSSSPVSNLAPAWHCIQSS